MTRTFREPDTARYHAAKNFFRKMLSHLIRDFVAEPISRVEHGQHQALEFETRAQRILDLVDRTEQRAEPLERVVLALHRNQHRIRRDQGIKSKNPKRGWRVD